MASNAFVLKSVEMKNWKTFADATLELSPEGLTGIVGKNGAGKSSFVDAIIWCLFGKQPSGSTKGALRRRKSDPVKEETLVKVTFTHAGQTVEAFRRMKGKNHTVSGGVFLDGVEVVIATGGTVESWIVNRLGMDDLGFKTAIVVPQKELDKLVDATASVRRETIERLAGIEDMNAAVKKAREAENEISKQVKVMPGSQEEIDAAGGFHEQASLEYESTIGEFDHACMIESQSRAALDKAVEENKDNKARLDAGFVLTNQLSELEHNKKIAQQSLDSLAAQLTEARSEVDDVDVSKRDELLARYKELVEIANSEQEGFNNAVSNLKSKNEALVALQNDLSEIDARIAKGRSYLESLNSALQALSSPQEVEERIGALVVSISNLQSSTGHLRGRMADLSESIVTLESIKDAAHCPTCQTKLEDPSKLVRSLSSMREDFASQLEAKQSELDDAQRKLDDANVESNRIRKSESDLTNAQSHLDELVGNRESLAARISNLESEINDLPIPDREAHSQRMAGFEEERRIVVEKGQKITQAVKTLEKVSRLEGEISNGQAEMAYLAPRIAELSSEINTYGNLESLDFLVAENEMRIEELRREHEQAFSNMKNLESSKGKLGERVSNALQNLEREKAIAAKKLKAIETLEERAAVSDLLDEYRKERISRIAPELSATATEMISQMTNGRFVEVIVEDDFSTKTVKEDGYEYGVADLSGGEKSILALALRIAIGSLLSGDNGGLLWLDEVLPAQDNERRDAILGVLRELPIQQIVMINHTHEAEDVVDNVVRVVYGEDGSTIEY